MLTYARRRKFKKAKVGDVEDMISNLPDSIIIHVLSLLDTKESVKTSLLSTRWKSLWTSVPTLRLHEYHFCLKADRIKREEKARIRFLNFVDSVLIGHSVPVLEKVDIHGSCDSSRFESWICAALECKVRKLQLYLYDDLKEANHVLPRSIFTCSTLVVLEIGYMLLDFPTTTTTCLPNLKILILVSITFKDDYLIRNLISGCPILEDLVIRKSEVWDNLGTLNVTSHSLRKLMLRFSFDDGPEQTRPSKMVIDAPSLESLEIEDSVTQDYALIDLSSLIKAKLQLSLFSSEYQDYDSYGTCLFNFLRRISNVKLLSIGDSTMMYLSNAQSYDLPTFPNLTCLEFFQEFDDPWNWKLVLAFLSSAPMLEVLIIESYCSFDEEFCSLQWDDEMPNCLLSQLKTIEFKGRVREKDVETIKYFLKSAKVLEKMKISSYYFHAKLQWKICEELFKLSRGSLSWSNTELVISFV